MTSPGKFILLYHYYHICAIRYITFYGTSNYALFLWHYSTVHSSVFGTGIPPCAFRFSRLIKKIQHETRLRPKGYSIYLPVYGTQSCTAQCRFQFCHVAQKPGQIGLCYSSTSNWHSHELINAAVAVAAAVVAHRSPFSFWDFWFDLELPIQLQSRNIQRIR